MESEDNIITVNNKNEYFPKARLLLVDHVMYHLCSQDISLDDDTILNEIKFTTPSDGTTPTLNCLQQALIIALW